MLIGQLPAMTFSMKANTPQGEQKSEQTLNDVSICRMDRSGNVVARKMKDEEKFRGTRRLPLMPFNLRQLDSSPLPAGAVAIGAAWESDTESALQGIPLPMPGKVSSTFAEIKTVDGHRCALINAEAFPKRQEGR